MTTRQLLERAVTRFYQAQEARADRRKRPSEHNRYALGVYLMRVDDILADIQSGTPANAAIDAQFTGSLATFVKRFLRDNTLQ